MKHTLSCHVNDVNDSVSGVHISTSRTVCPPQIWDLLIARRWSVVDGGQQMEHH
jgi:hypothetical protein